MKGSKKGTFEPERERERESPRGPPWDEGFKYLPSIFRVKLSS